MCMCVCVCVCVCVCARTSGSFQDLILGGPSVLRRCYWHTTVRKSINPANLLLDSIVMPSKRANARIAWRHTQGSIHTG